MKEKILVIGAGIAGLYSADLLQQDGYQVIVLEASDRVGGRTYTQNNVDLGGQWISSVHLRAMKLCERFGLEYYRQYEDGFYIRYFNGKRDVLKSKYNVLTKDTIQNELTPYIKLFDKMIEGDIFINQKHLDKISFGDWCRGNISNTLAYQTIMFSFDLLVCADPNSVSMFFWLYFLKSCHGYSALVGIENAAQEFILKDGAQSICNSFSANINVVFDSEVIEVTKENNGYQVLIKNKKIYYADKIISAIPVPLVNKINWQPAFEAGRISFYNSYKMGRITKLVIEYEDSFWKIDGYSAQIISDSPPVYLAYDGCKGKRNAIIVFVTKDIGYSDEQITNHLATLLNNDKAKTPIKIHKKNWNQDPYSGGGYFSVPPLNSLSLHSGLLTKPFEDIYFVGTETAHAWMGYMEGALESAERVVVQIKQSYFEV